LLEEQEKAAAVSREGVFPVPRFTFDWSDRDAVCPACGLPLRVRLTREPRRVVSLTYGDFRAIERQGYCPAHPGLPPARSLELRRIVPPGSNVAYDVLVRIGMARYLECRQLEEIQEDLSTRHPNHIEIPVKTIGYLAQKFVAYFQVVHQESIPLLRRDMRKRGGYILHIDGTCEEGSRVLLVCLDSLSGQILESRKINSESTEEVRRVLKFVRRDWGVPLAVVHDLRKSLIKAARKVFPGVPQFVCHYHLAADVGEDILSGHVDNLRCLFRRTKVRPKLGALCRSLREFAVPEDGGDHVVSSVLACTDAKCLQELVTPETTNGTIHALISWILAFFRAGEGYGFPFDMPYLTLYERIVDVYKVLAQASAVWPKKCQGAIGTIQRLKEILETVVASERTEEFNRVVAETREALGIFDRFRAALRICPKGGKSRRNDEGVPSTLSPARHRAILKNLRTSLLRQARLKKSTEKACLIVVKHIDKYWKYLFGHVVARRPRLIVVPRTNNVEERLFRTIKRQCRRLHGRGHLSRDVDAMAAGTALVLNIRNASYCQTVYGGTDPKRIAERFSEIDHQIPTKVMKSWRRERHSTRIPRRLEAMKNLPQRLARFIFAASRELQKQA
jgi:hypothetical protein